MRKWLEDTMAKHTNRSAEQIHKDIDRDMIIGAEDAVDYGLVDQVLTSRKRTQAS